MDLTRLRRNRFVVLGRAGMDLYADPPGQELEHARNFTSALGGSAANIAVAIVKLGGAASLLSTVSSDAVGRFTLNEMKRFGVDHTHVTVVGGEARTSLAVVESRSVNCQSVIYRNDAADFYLSTTNAEAVDYDKFGALIVTGTSLAAEPSRSATFRAMDMAAAAGVIVIIDVDYRPYSWKNAAEAQRVCHEAALRSQIVVGNDVEFGVMAGGGDGLDCACALAGSGERLVVYKMGEKGSVTFVDGGSFSSGIYNIKPLKPTGAGDAFMGAFVTSLAEGFDVGSSVRRGSAAAAITVTRVGCAPAVPTASELLDFMKHQTAPLQNPGS